MMGYGVAAALILLLRFVPTVPAACSDGRCKISEKCTQTSDCITGLVCTSNCSSNPICTMRSAMDVTLLNTSLPFNRYSWLTTHNSFAITNSPPLTTSPILTFENQEDSVTEQLKNGVRGLMLDMYDFMNDVWVCHSFGGTCQNITAFQPAVNTLKEIEAFLSANPSAVITIFIEDYVRSPKGLTNVFTRAGLMKYLFPLSRMPKDGSNWPTLSSMIAQNQRLILFTSIASKEASEGIAYEWNYVVENQYGDAGLAGKCSNRAESAPLATKSRALVLENYFPTNPQTTQACRDNSKPLSQIIKTCFASAGNRWANFLAVDFYKRSTGGGSFRAVDTLNGNLLCGCSDVHECQSNLAQGVCNTTNAPRVAQGTDGDDNSASPTEQQPRAVSSSLSSRSPPRLLLLLLLLLFIAVAVLVV